jgi:hypothetical protein
MKRKKLLTILAILFCFATTQGQNEFVINLIDNTTVKTSFSDIQKITFYTDEMLLKTNSDENGYLLDNIASITFLEEVGIKEVKEAIDVNVFITSSGEIVVESSHQINKLTVFDLAGREVTISLQNKMNINFLPAGLYILQVATDKGLVSKKFIKNK